jgi:hypothetical protein
VRQKTPLLSRACGQGQVRDNGFFSGAQYRQCLGKL